MNALLFSIWFFLPAAVANMTPIPVSKIPFLKKYDYPADFNKTFRGVRIFGDHKTIRGFVSGILVAIAVSWLQIALYQESEFIQRISPINYSDINPLIFGTLAGFGALLGDAVKSFFKRRVGIPPGKTWIPFDQIDFIIGGLLFISLYITLEWYYYPLILLTYLVLHFASTIVGYAIGMKDDPI